MRVEARSQEVMGKGRSPGGAPRLNPAVFTRSGSGRHGEGPASLAGVRAHCQDELLGCSRGRPQPRCQSGTGDTRGHTHLTLTRGNSTASRDSQAQTAKPQSSLNAALQSAYSQSHGGSHTPLTASPGGTTGSERACSVSGYSAPIQL